MRLHVLRVLALITFSVLLAVGLASCSSSVGPGAGSDGHLAYLVQKDAVLDGVQLRVTPVEVGANGARFIVATDSESDRLSRALPAAATLTVAGIVWPFEGWSASPNGDARDEITFRSAGPAVGEISLDLTGTGEPVRITWVLPGGGS